MRCDGVMSPVPTLSGLRALTFPPGPPGLTAAGSWAGMGRGQRSACPLAPAPLQLPSPSLTHSAPPSPAASTPLPTVGKPSQKGREGGRETDRQRERALERWGKRERRQTDRQTQMESEMVTGKRIERDNKRQRNCERGTKAKNEREQDSERDRHGETETVGAKRDADNRDSERAETVSQTTQQPQRLRQRGTC